MTEERKKRILLVEDEVIIALKEAKTIESFGYSVDVANSGEEALGMIEEGMGIDLVLMDIDLGRGMSGPEAVERILERKPLPIVFLTSHSEREMVEKVRGITRYGYVIKNSGDFVLQSSIELAFELFEANEELKESEWRHKVVSEIVSDYIVVIDFNSPEDYCVNWISDNLLHETGWTFETVRSSLTWDAIIHPEYRERFWAFVDAIISTGKPGVLECKSFGKDGEERWIRILARASIREGSGKTTVVGAIKDISDSKSYLEALNRKTEELDRYFNGSLDLLCIADTEGHFRRLNPEWEKTLGYSLKELEGASFLDFVHPEDKERTLRAIDDLSSQKAILNFENRYRTKGGDYKWIEWRAYPEGGTIYAAARDITDRKAAEERIKALLAEKELLLGEVHHRIKNNMSVIENLLSMQADSTKSPEAAVALSEASGRVQSMEILYEKLYQSLDFREATAKEYFAQLAREIFDLFPNSGNIKIDTQIDDFKLSTQIIFPLGIAVNELITNSMKHAFRGREGGRILLKISRSGALVRVSVEDDGIGIPEGPDGSTKRGFGINLVGLLAQQIGGRFSIENSGGTACRIEFPESSEQAPRR